MQCHRQATATVAQGLSAIMAHHDGVTGWPTSGTWLTEQGDTIIDMSTAPPDHA